MKRSDIIGNDEIKQIDIDLIDKDPTDIKVISDVQQGKGKTAVKVAFSTFFIALIMAVIFVGIYIGVNMKFVQGDVSGSRATVLGWSMLEKDYAPYNEIREGVIVYYDGEQNNFLNFANGYKVGKVIDVSDNKVKIQNGQVESMIFKHQVQFVLTKG